MLHFTLAFGIILGMLTKLSVQCQQAGHEPSTAVSFLSSSSQVQFFLKLQKPLKHIISGFQWVWTSCLKWCKSKWFNSCTCIWTFSRHNEMGNFFKISRVSIAVRHRKAWIDISEQGRGWFSRNCWESSGLGPADKDSISRCPGPSPLTSMMYNFLITNTIVPKGLSVSSLIIFSVWNKTLSFNKKEV